ncbi:FCD domain protein [Methylobrevis pamukkalensis]|uniref:FCD domain protein n=2 Tax=Methylobrevis pamukkalensis TaxID=1439726 RepID=A0A1E3GNZ6_9HYPH|nr:FCD domain protein [Methylobrevis pamukkalensis]
MSLGEMSGNRLLERYLGEVVSRCSLILALYGRPHSSDCAVNEHSQIIEALRSGDAEAAIKLMDHHIGAVEKRALIEDAPTADLSGVLAHYAAPLLARQTAVPLGSGPRAKDRTRDRTRDQAR